MKHLPRALILVVAIVCALLANAQNVNPKAVAQLKWYPVNTSTNTQFSIPTTALGFDGKNIWAGSSGQLVKIRPSDNVVLGTFSYPSTPSGTMAFDGLNLWAVNPGANSVTKVRASDGAVLSTVSVGHDPISVVFDGTNIWIINSDATIGGTVMVLRSSDGAILHTTTPVTAPLGAMFDGANIWVSATDVTGVAKLSSTGTNLSVVNTGFTPTGPPVFDGTVIWVALSEGGGGKFNAASPGSVTSWGGAPVYSLVFDGVNIWALTDVGMENFPVSTGGAGAGGPYGPSSTQKEPLAFDGVHIWLPVGSSLWKL